MELELTPQIKAWLDCDPAERDLEAGAELLLRVSRNRILYKNVTHNITAKAATIEYHLKKIYLKRLQATTHEQVRELMTQVESIDRDHGLSKPQSVAHRSDLQRGKRSDHDLLPEDIRNLYEDNLDIMRRMRDLHTQLRLISPDNSTCPDSDRYPLAKALIDYDRRYRDNWNIYDHYVKGSNPAETVREVDPRSASKNALKTLYLQLGKYAKNPSDALADLITQGYKTLVNPPEQLTQKMNEAGLL